MSAKYKSPSFLLPNELNTSANPANDTGINSLYSMDFDGSNDYIDLGTTTDYDNGDLSASIWVYALSTRTTTTYAFSNSGSSSIAGFDIAVKTNNNVRVSRNTRTKESGSGWIDIGFTDDAWQHLAFTYNDSTNTIKLFLNGVLKNISTGTTQSTIASKKLTIGSYITTISLWKGKLDEASIFNYTLSDGGVSVGQTATGNIAALYGGTSPNIYPSNLMASNLNPIAYYPLGEQAQMQGYLGNEASSEWQFPNGVLQDYVMDFDGGDNINIVDAPSSNGTQTLSMWINTSTSGDNGGLFTIVSNGATSDYWSVALWNSNIQCSTANTGSSKQSTTNVADGDWHNIIFVKSSSVCTHMYIDGNLQTLSNGSWQGSINTPQAKIGSGNYSNTEYYFTGKISNVVLWTSDQSANKDNIYNNGSPQTSYTVSPQNWWKLNADSVYTPSAPNYTTALDFVASESDYIDCGDSDDFSFGNNSNDSPFSVSFFVNLNSYPSTNIVFVSKDDGSPNREYAIGMFSGNRYVRFFIKNAGGNNQQSVDSSTTIAIGSWYHVVATYDGRGGSNAADGMNLYINSIKETTSLVKQSYTAMANTTAPFRIGQYNSQAYVDGKMSNTAIFNSALTPTQVSTLFNFGTPETNISFSPISWWKLDNLTTGIQDSGSASNNGTNNGTTQVNSSVAVVPSWKIPSALTIPTINYTTALSFDGTNSTYIDLNNITSLNSVSKASYSFWFKLTSNTPSSGSNSVTLIGSSAKGASCYYYGSSSFYIHNFNSKFILTTQPSLNEWHHVCCVFDSGVAEAYVDGSSVGTVTEPTLTTTASDFGNNFSVGYSTFYSDYINNGGQISNVALFNSALSASQVSTLFNFGTPETAISFSPQAWWKLDDQTAITDSSGNGNTGTNNGATQVTSDVFSGVIPSNGVSTTLPSTALQQSDLQFDSPFSNYSLSFDGLSNLNLGNVQNNNSLTFSTWINTTSTNASIWQTIATNQSAGAGYRFQYLFSNGNSVILHDLQHGGGSSSSGQTVVSGFNDGNWHHFAFTYDGTSNINAIRMYVDTVEVYTNNSTLSGSGIAASTSNLYLSGGATSAFLAAKFDEFSIFNYSLTSAQVLEIYNNGRPKDLSTFSGAAPTNWWRLGENAYFNTGTTPGPEFTVPNSISGANNGTGYGTITTMISANAPGTYANGIGENLDILDRVGDAALSTSNSQSYNMIPSDISPYVPQYVGKQIANNFSMTFDAASLDYINVGIPNFLSAKSTFTISLWFNTNDIDSQTTLCMVGGSASQLWGLSKFQDDLIIYGGSSTKYYIKNTLFNINTWYNLIVVYDGSQSNANRYKAYIDGSLLTSPTVYGTIDTTTPTFTTDFNIGRVDYAAAGYFNGKIDEVAIFDTALNAGQIYNDIYQPTATGTNQTADFVNNPNLPNPVAWYRMGD